MLAGDSEKKEDIEKVSQNLAKWLAEIPDEMDVLLAHRDFDEAVAYVEQGI